MLILVNPAPWRRRCTRVPASFPAYTVLAIKALVLSGMVTREELEAGFMAAQ